MWYDTFYSILNCLLIVGNLFANSILIYITILYFDFEECDAGTFTCDDGSCILDTDVCNQIKDCPNGSDEIYCPATTNSGNLAYLLH